MLTRLLIAAICLAAPWGAVSAQGARNPAHQLSDAPSGVGCRQYSVGGRLAWQRPLGDWLDRKGTLHGNDPYATTSAGRRTLADGLSLDVTELARKWLDGSRPNTGVMLRALAGQGTLQIASRESKTGQGPALELQWQDQTTQRLAPNADVTLDCSTVKGIGRSPRLRISPDHNTVVVFDLPARPAGQLRAARLVLYPEKLFGKTVTVGAFSTQPPWAEASVARTDGLAARHPGDQGIGRAPEVLFAADFEQEDWLSAWNRMTRSEMAIVDAGEQNGFAPLRGKALKTTLKQGENNALNLRYLFARRHGEEPEEIYFRYYLRFGTDWNPDRDGGKLPGLAGTYGKGGWGMRKSDGTNGWSVRGAFARSMPAGAGEGRVTPIGSYVYQADMKGNSGSNWGWGDGPGGLLQNNRWYSIEQHIKLNTPGEHDGVFRAWIDGHQVIEKTGLSFRIIPDLRIESVWMNVYHGGTATSPRDMSLYIDNVVIARSYIGPIPCPAGKQR